MRALVSVLILMLTDSTKMLAQTAQETAGEDIYIVMIVTLLIWGGLFFYLLYLDRKVKAVSERIKIDGEVHNQNV